MIQLKPIIEFACSDIRTSILFYRESQKEKHLPSCAKKVESFLDLKAGDAKKYLSLADDKLACLVFAPLEDETDYDALEKSLAASLRLVKQDKADRVRIVLFDDALKNLSKALYKQLYLANDSFDDFKTSGVKPLSEKQEKKEDKKELSFEVYLSDAFDMDEENAKLSNAKHISDGILLARRLLNLPANILTPVYLSEQAKSASEKFGFDIEIYDEKQIQEMGMKAFYSVAMGSDNPPRFMVMRYMNNKDSNELLALVGKGLTYDSGGYALKPALGMDTMYSDMGGSAAVIGAISCLAAMKAKVNVVAVVASCENMISGHAYRNGDIIGSLAGKYIEVVNTDAEGRLTLADAITYSATVLKADRIIDIATLTGAVGIALGDDISGVVSDNEEMYQAILKASEEAGDKVWRLPHYDCLANRNKSERADIKNSGGRPGGSSTAALFCRAFAFNKPWAHLDIAATAFHEKGNDKAPNGGTGVGVEILSSVAIQLFSK